MLAISQNNSSNLSIPSPLEGVQRVGSYSSQSALSINMPNFATFSAWITIYLPILISLWIITLAVSGCHLLSLLINLFVLFSSYRIGWSAVRLLSAFHFQTAMNPNTSTNNTNDSFEQLLNQYLAVTQHWFSSDRARPRFRAGGCSTQKIINSSTRSGTEESIRPYSSEFQGQTGQDTKTTISVSQQSRDLKVTSGRCGPEIVNRTGGNSGFRCIVRAHG